MLLTTGADMVVTRRHIEAAKMRSTPNLETEVSNCLGSLRQDKDIPVDRTCAGHFSERLE